MSMPLWVTEGQLQRLQQMLEQAGFISVAFDTDEDQATLTVTASRYRKTHRETIDQPEGMASVVQRFKAWARGADPGEDAFE